MTNVKCPNEAFLGLEIGHWEFLGHWSLDLGSSRQNVLHHIPAHIGQPKISPRMPIGQPFMIEAEEVEHGGMEVVDVDDILHGPEAEFVRGAVGVAASSAATGKPAGEAVMVVVAAVKCGILGNGCAAEFTTP